MDCQDKLESLYKQIEDKNISDKKRDQIIQEFISQSQLKQSCDKNNFNNNVETTETEDKKYKNSLKNPDNDYYSNKLSYKDYCEQQNQNNSNLKQNQACAFSKESKVISNISVSNKQNESEQLQIDLKKEYENLSRLEEEEKQIDKSNTQQLISKQEEIDFTKVKILSLLEQTEQTQQTNQDCNFSENKWQTEDQNKYTSNDQLFNNQQSQQDYLARSDMGQMKNENEIYFQNNYLNKFEEENQIKPQTSNFFQRNDDQAILNHYSALESQIKGMNDQEVLNFIESKRSQLVQKLDEKYELKDSLISKMKNLQLGNEQNDQQQIEEIENNCNDIFCQFDALNIKQSSIIQKQSNTNLDSRLEIERQSIYNENINSKRRISQLENDYIMQDENKITVIYNQNTELSSQTQRDHENKQQMIYQNGQQNTQRVILERIPSSNSITIYASKKEHLEKGFIENIFSNNIGLSQSYSQLQYNLKDNNIKKYTLYSKYFKNKQIQKFAYQFLAAQLLNNQNYFEQNLNFDEKNYLAKFAQVLKDYLNLRNMSIISLEINESGDNIHSLFVKSSNADEILITELYLKDQEVCYKLLVDYKGVYLDQIKKQQSLQEGLFPQKKVRLCMLPLRNIKNINFCEFDEKDVKDFQKDQTKKQKFRTSMIKWFGYQVNDQLTLNYTTSEYKGQKLSLEKFVNSIVEEGDQELIQKYYDLDNSDNLLVPFDCKNPEAIKQGEENFKKFYYIHILLCMKLNIPLLQPTQNSPYNGQAVNLQRNQSYDYNNFFN